MLWTIGDGLEVILWAIFRKMIEVSARQLYKLDFLPRKKEHPIYTAYILCGSFFSPTCPKFIVAILNLRTFLANVWLYCYVVL